MFNSLLNVMIEWHFALCNSSVFCTAYMHHIHHHTHTHVGRCVVPTSSVT